MKKEWRTLIFITVMLVAISGVSMVPRIRPMVGVAGKAGSEVLFLDPGHGGMDGGASGAAGVCEKNINLEIAKYIRDMAEADGWQVVMSREKDEGVYGKDTESGSTGERKRSIRSLKTEDLKNRVDMIEKAEPRLTVSIHLNSFKQNPSVHGAQTFYPEGDQSSEAIAESKRLAEIIQSKLVQGIDDGTNRAALPKGGIKLFKSPKTPIVIVECGFLSNRNEETLLLDKDYQRKLAKYIYEGILEYTGKKVQNSIPGVDSRG